MRRVSIALIAGIAIIGLVVVVYVVFRPRPLEPEQFTELANQLQHGNHMERVHAYHALTQGITDDHVSDLVQLLETSPNHEARWRAARLLGTLGGEEAVDALIRAVEIHGIAWVRWSAAHALQDLREPLAYRALEAAMYKDHDPHVRKRCATALFTIDPVAGRNSIQKAKLTEKAPDVLLTFRWLLEHPDHQGTQTASINPGQITEGRHQGTRYWIYVPAGYEPYKDMPKLLVAVHGTDGMGNAYLDIGKADADRRNFVILAPWFDYPTYFHFDNMNIGSMALNETRTDLRLLEIIDDLSRAMKLDTERFWIFGQSRGGQFVTRFAYAHPNRIARAAACGSGNYVHPWEETYVPYGVMPNPFAPDLSNLDYANLVQMPLAVILGTRETEAHLREGQAFMDTVNRYAEMHGLASQVVYIPVEGGTHHGPTNFRVALKFLLQE